MWLANAVDRTQIGRLLEEWEAEDQRCLGGRPKPFPAATAIVGLLLAATVHGSVLDTTIHQVLYQEISDRMRDRLGIRTSPPGRTGIEPDTYRQVNRRLNSLLGAIDPSPWRKNRILTKTEAEDHKKPLSDADIGEHTARLDLLVHLLLHLSYMLIPRDLRRRWKGAMAVDGTPIPQFTRGVRRDSAWMAADPDCAWYCRGALDVEGHAKAEQVNSDAKTGSGTSRIRDPKGRKANRKASFYGMEATLVVMCGEDPGGASYHPNLVLGMVLDQPGFRIGENGTRTIRQVADLTGKTGWLAGDRAYSNALPDKFQLPTRALGCRHVFDYRRDQLGVATNYAGAIQVEGCWYCPSMPQLLIDASIDFREGRIDWETYQTRIGERVHYAMRVKERLADGSVRLHCPAASGSPQAACPLKPTSYRPAKVGQKQIEVRAEVSDGPPAVCSQGSVLVPIEAGAKLHQELAFGSPEHKAIYAHLRNTVEGVNGTSKDGGASGLGQATRRRKRGIAAQSLLVVGLLFAENLRKISAFMRAAAPDAAGTLVVPRRARAARRDPDDRPLAGPRPKARPPSD